MISNFAKILLTLTSVAPALITCAWVAYIECEYSLSFILLAICIALVVSCLFVFRYARKKLERMEFKIKTAEIVDRENISIFMLYLFPLIKISTMVSWYVIIPVFIIVIVLTITGHQYHFNPLLNMLGWHFYKVGTEEGISYVLITKKKISQAIDIKESCQLTEYVIIDLEGEKP